ncbi:AMP-binding enzyme [Leptospira inadai serovar Lyme str. 10]|uniref:AMP-binding enzyme n=2 Tax=Leptospira inadai serovar Lyme TaxID=293084 RepID=V6HC49_9LEPT|nr:AMP-binding protein [Leptospira inadai]EQA37162.1 AMP-binding enzyme [Leptospira inadai serovar Lyme str. 10]PNV76634.1 long-chain fatty acid--CoA ligase [Leptospira inadai serovar Lyme]
MEKPSIYHLVSDSCRQYRDRPFHWIWDEKQHTFTGISYGEWFSSLERLSGYLLSKGLRRGDKVGLICDNRTEWSLCSFSIVCAGGVDVPRGCDASAEDITYILTHTDAKIVFLEKNSVLKKLSKHPDCLSAIEVLIVIEDESTFEGLSQIRSQFPKLEVLGLDKALSSGEQYLSKKGPEVLRQAGESLTGKDIATIIYTSGTTGVPKGVVLKHRSFTWSVQELQQFVPVTYSDRTVVFLPPWHIAERILETALLSWGASMASSNVTNLQRDFGLIQPTVLVSVPRVWEALYRKIWDTAKKGPSWKFKVFSLAVKIAEFHSSLYDTITGNYATTEDEPSDQKALDKFVALAFFGPVSLANLLSQKILQPVRASLGGRLRFAFCGAGAMPSKIQFFFRSLGIPIIETYGMTETTGMGAMGRFPIPKTGAIGPVFPGAHIKLLDETGTVITESGIKGTAWHKGPHVTSGYYKDEEKNTASLIDNWFDSGDLFVWTKTGELKFAGRAKDTIVLSSGENVEPEPIEAKISESEFIQFIVVVGQDRKFLNALIVPNFEKLREKFAKSGQTLPEANTEIVTNPTVLKFYKELLKEKISEGNGFKNFERISNFLLIEKPFEKGQELTETMKIKRKVVLENYSRQINELYS